ncbi:hypothetical protein [Nocardiopsis synnemataformans]|uniref:hypothetical protein n=1 Tax=Nocardiopsis synnemataformans TaxID=61305 RepID=UPI003EBF7B8F
MSDLSDPCLRCGADVGEPCDPICVNAEVLSDDEYAGLAGYPDTLIDGLLEGGGCL